MKWSDLKPSALGALSASVASLCCLLPLVVVVLGLGSGAFMAVTMRYSAIFIPAGILGTAAGYALYVRERRRCDRLGCAMAGSRLNRALLGLSTLVLAAAVTLTALPDYTARLIASWGGAVTMEHAMSGGSGGSGAGAHTRVGSAPAIQHGALVAAASATLRVEGMT
jgi:hypothetical protein